MLLKKRIEPFGGTDGYNTRLWYADPFGTLSVYGYGSGGFISSVSRMDGKTPLPDRRLPLDVARRLAAAMNSVDGLATADLTADLMERVKYCLSHTRTLPDRLGGENAEILWSALRDAYDQDRGNHPRMHPFDAHRHTDSKSPPFTWGLCTDLDNPLDTSVSVQTYRQEDAERLAAAWNATIDLALPVLEMRLLQDAMNLIVALAGMGEERIVKDVTTFNPSDECAEILARGIAEELDQLAGVIEASRRASGVGVDPDAPEVGPDHGAAEEDSPAP